MTVKIEACYAGNSNYYFRLEWRNGGRIIREHISGDTWDRSMATKALNLLESVYGFTRRNVRFKEH